MIPDLRNATGIARRCGPHPNTSNVLSIAEERLATLTWIKELIVASQAIGSSKVPGTVGATAGGASSSTV
jgi:hypothetical protein